jgi:hypothetical protein
MPVVGEAACGRWGISQNRKFLWGNAFYWLCDCSAMCEILEYDGPIHQIRRWAQELLGYYFHIFHRAARMMKDVDGLNRRFDHTLIQSYEHIAQTLAAKDRAARPIAYSAAAFATHNPLKCTPLPLLHCPSLLDYTCRCSPLLYSSSSPLPYHCDYRQPSNSIPPSCFYP